MPSRTETDNSKGALRKKEQSQQNVLRATDLQKAYKGRKRRQRR